MTMKTFDEPIDMTAAYKQVVENQKNKKTQKRWQDDDGDGKWYEKSDVDGKISEREKKAKKEEVDAPDGEQLDEISADTALKASKAADVKRGKLAVAGDKEGAAAKSAQAVRLYKKQAAKRKQENQKEEVETTEVKKLKEAFVLSNDEWQDLAEHGKFIDELNEEELVEFMEVCLLETAEDDDDLVEICEEIETLELHNAYFEESWAHIAVGSAKKASELTSKKDGGDKKPARLERMKSAVKKAAKKIKGAVKKVAKKGAQAAGKVAGEFQASREKQKKAALNRPDSKPKEKQSNDDGTGGKLDKLLAKTRGKRNGSNSDTSSSSDSSGSSNQSGSSSSSSSSSGSTRKAVGGALKSVGSLIKKGLKKAVGKTSRLVAKGSDKLAKRLGEDYDEIAGLVESGLFTFDEIENVLDLDEKISASGYARAKKYREDQARQKDRDDNAKWEEKARTHKWDGKTWNKRDKPTHEKGTGPHARKARGE
tara:strand:+ start:1771 stop:3216 length:1446 start_codon:yes stop_codon:yes gene_type:complete